MKNIPFDAVIFDLDGVITKTALVHSAAWKKMFDDFLKQYSLQNNTEFKEFDHEKDYLPYVDGKPRYKGVESFLHSRGINLPYGNPEDTPDMLTICGLGNRKNIAFNQVLDNDGVQVYPSTIEFINELHKAGKKVGVASSSKNCAQVLEKAGISNLFMTRVDGVISAETGLKGKPEPDIFTTACNNIDVEYHKAIIVEDAVSGVQAGRNGSFGLVIGLAREDNHCELKANGADLVFSDLSEMNTEDLANWFSSGLLDDSWQLEYCNLDEKAEKSRESLLTIGNGYMGTRGAFEESVAGKFHYPGTYIAGVYNKLDSEVAGKTVSNEDFVNCPDWIYTSFRIDDEDWFEPKKEDILALRRILNFRTGELSRILHLKDSKGRETRIESTRIASMHNPHAAAISYSITPLNYSGKITVKSALRGNIINAGVNRYSQLNQKHLEPVLEEASENFISLLIKTTSSGILVAETARFYLYLGASRVCPVLKTNTSPGYADAEIEFEAIPEQSVKIEKIVTVFTSLESEDPLQQSKKEHRKISGYDDLLENSREAWNEIWKKSDIVIEGDRGSQKLVRLHIFHTMVAASFHNKNIDASVPARGLHGEAYRGHIFWDELFIIPFYSVHFPEIAKSLLLYRYKRLGEAKKYAMEAGCKGAMFPWQSGSSGTEETQEIHLNPESGEWGPDHSRLQRHVSLAIGYNFIQYYNLTGDKDFMLNYGLELIIEICRFWAGKAEENSISKRYSIAGVMGPDEFHEQYPGSDEGGLNNNAYSNLMAVWLFNSTRQIIESLETNEKEEVFIKNKLTPDELGLWKDISQNIGLDISPEGIIAQFDGYFNLEELDWHYYKEKYGNIYRMDRLLKAEGKSPDLYKVAKQADTLMTFFNLKEFTVSKILSQNGYILPVNYLKLNFDYYLKKTSHGSTLSRMVHGYVANLIGQTDLAWTLYSEALGSDLKDIQGGTTAEGVHSGVMTGTALMAITSFAGVDLREGEINIQPKLPPHWNKISFSIMFRGVNIRINVFRNYIEISADEALKIKVKGQKIDIGPHVNKIMLT